MSWDDDDTVFDVVINHEEQYSIWPVYKQMPNGWTAVGKRGSKQECLAHIDEVWTDMRPLSLRKFMAEQAGAAVAPAIQSGGAKGESNGVHGAGRTGSA